MTVLFLGPEDSSLPIWLREREQNVVQTEQKIGPGQITAQGVDFLVSYGYRHKLSRAVLEAVGHKAVNLHISYLPWNRGADPNFWSFVENTPKGVTIHFIDEGIDTGDIIVQELVAFDTATETLASSYDKLHDRIQSLFKAHWDEIKAGTCERRKQQGPGSCHRSRDKEAHTHLLTDGWNTPVELLYNPWASELCNPDRSGSGQAK